MDTNNYIKQYPELMKGKKILYVHGFASSGQSGTVKRLREVFPAAEVVAPDLPLNPLEALTLLQVTCKEIRPDLIIGTSMGGMFAEMLYGYDRICVNPAMHIGDTMVSHNMVGAQHFHNPRKDGVQDFLVTKALVKEYKELTDHCYEGCNAEEKGRVTGLFGDEDDLVNTYEEFSAHYPVSIHFHGAHRMDDKSFMHSVLPVIRWIDDRQEGRERPIVYIDISAMIDRYSKPLSALMKALRMLIETYQVYFVAPAPTNNKSYISQIQEWCEQHINVPAYGRVIFTNQKNLLYGDYIVDADETADFMGTKIVFGSDAFKSWEEIIMFFKRLGGQ